MSRQDEAQAAMLPPCFRATDLKPNTMFWGLTPMLKLLSHRSVQKPRLVTSQVWGVAFRPDGQQLASVSDDKSVVLYSFSE